MTQLRGTPLHHCVHGKPDLKTRLTCGHHVVVRLEGVATKWLTDHKCSALLLQKWFQLGLRIGQELRWDRTGVRGAGGELKVGGALLVGNTGKGFHQPVAAAASKAALRARRGLASSTPLHFTSYPAPPSMEAKAHRTPGKGGAHS